MMPDEVRRLPKDQAILLIRGSKPLKLSKITPEEHPFFDTLKPCKAIDHIPVWRQKEKSAIGAQSPQIPAYPVRIPAEPEQETSEEIVLDAEDAAPDIKIEYKCADGAVYERDTPNHI